MGPRLRRGAIRLGTAAAIFLRLTGGAVAALLLVAGLAVGTLFYTWRPGICLALTLRLLLTALLVFSLIALVLLLLALLVFSLWFIGVHMASLM